MMAFPRTLTAATCCKYRPSPVSLIPVEKNVSHDGSLANDVTDYRRGKGFPSISLPTY
jgi:hypothetical protein